MIIAVIIFMLFDHFLSIVLKFIANIIFSLVNNGVDQSLQDM